MKHSFDTTALNAYRYWARQQFSTFKSCVAYIESEDVSGDKSIGTCFHVGDGVFVTARHVVDGRKNFIIGFDNGVTPRSVFGISLGHEVMAGQIQIIDGPHFHNNREIDVACFKVNCVPEVKVRLGGHLDDFMTNHEFLLYRVLIIGFPPIPLADRPVLVATVGEVNAQVDLYVGKHPRFIVSSMARGGFSGGPALIAYDELNADSGTAVLGLVTEALVSNASSPEVGYLAVLTVEPIYECLESAGYSISDQDSLMSLYMEREAPDDPELDY
ncbi:hypothetical protein GO613_12860 [Azoarcus communis]|uniref:trypsin-like peptidase domain-containing protein n=1 Tax=Parazoarcus communis TaxID=41977 RepID=UPI0014593BF1|nr:trypsin-like peptidase domain-containing protein [Parazoarcus communis]NMG48992.1 hypothetical protein [Parazoarcus communis]